ncbi:hypothetical protein [Cytobacillus praedii]|nr:hypothetical protein [Cytobacillus praedii]
MEYEKLIKFIEDNKEEFYKKILGEENNKIEQINLDRKQSLGGE